ncbi:MAG: fibronectin type III domain-containing protein [Treponema sp.]|nr:fibronectin type III domain-containing protein [Treponema sp.]
MKINIHFLLLIFTLFCFNSCSYLFQDKVPMQTGKNLGNLSTLLTKETVATKLSPTTQVFVSQGLSPSTIFISWNAVPNAIYYEIEKAIVKEKNASGNFETPNDEDFLAFQDYVYGTTYNDVILHNPTNSSVEYSYAYFYRISAVNTRSNFEASDFTVSKAATLFSSPTDVQADLGNSTESITVSWKNSNNASQYLIFRTTNADGSGLEKIASVTANMNYFTNYITEKEQGVDFYYAIIAENSNFIQSVQSNLALGYALVAGAPSKVSSVEVVSGEGRGDTLASIKITWSEVVADSEVKYSVYRTSSEDSSLSLLTAGTTTTSFTDTTTLKPGIFYYYKVQAWTLDAETGTKLKSQLSDSIAEGYILSAPTKIESSKTLIGENFLRFNAAIGTDTEKQNYTYNIYGDASNDGDFSTLLQSFAASDIQTDEDGFYTVNINVPTKFYKIKTQNSKGIESIFSNATTPAPFAPQTINVSKNFYINGASANGSGVYPVKIMWEKPNNDDPDGYILYRSVKTDSGWRKVFDSPISDLSYIDNNDTAKAGTYYYYKVLAVNSLGQGTNYSPNDFGYGALSHEQYMREYNKTIKNSHKKLTLMNKSNDMDKIGNEKVNGIISGTLEYNAAIQGLGARITMRYENFADFYINNDASQGVYFCVTGNTNTTANMSANGTMDGTMECTGMYPGKVYYDKIEIKGGNAGGGTYGIEPVGSTRVEVSWTIGEE